MALQIMAVIDIICGVIFVIVGIMMHVQVNQVNTKYTGKTMGTVVGPAHFNYGYGIYLPLVTYRVENKDYNVEGPTFRNINFAKEDQLPLPGKFGTNVEDPNNPPERLFIEKRDESAAKEIMTTPMLRVYPRGTQLPVYYLPEKPEKSYVLRMETSGKKKLATVFIVAGILLFAVAWGVFAIA